LIKSKLNKSAVLLEILICINTIIALLIFLQCISTVSYNWFVQHGYNWINWSIYGLCNHILLNIWLWVQISIHVWPSSIFIILSLKICITLSFHHCSMLILKNNFIILLFLSACKLLHGPLVFFRVLILSCKLDINTLVVSLSNNIFNLILSKTLKVVWNKSMRSKLRFSGFKIFSHNIAHVSSSNLFLIHAFLIIPPCLFSTFLLSSKILIVCLHFFSHLCLSLMVFIFKNASHLKNSISLLCIHNIFSLVILILPLVFI